MANEFLDFRNYPEPNGGQLGVDRNNLLLRGCVLKNTKMIIGMVIYAGKVKPYLS